MRVGWSFQRSNRWFGRFHIKKPFTIYIDWNPTYPSAMRWKATIRLKGHTECGNGRTLAEALTVLYMIVSENYAQMYDVYQDYLMPSMLIARHR